MTQGLQIWRPWGVEPSREIWTKMWTLWYSLEVKFRQVLVEKSTSVQWLKWSCEAGGSPDEERLEQTPYPIHNPHPTNLVLFGHKITPYRFNQGAHTIAGGSNRSRSPLTLTNAPPGVLIVMRCNVAEYL